MPGVTTTNYLSKVEVNGIFLPQGALFDSLRRFVTPVYFYGHLLGMPHLAALGSSLHVRFCKRYFRITCRHVADRNGFEQAMAAINWLEPDQGWRAATANRVYGVAAHDPKPIDDFVIAEFADLSEAAQRLFLDVSDEYFLARADHPNLCYADMFLIGYPTERVEARWNSAEAAPPRIEAWVLEKHFAVI